MKTTKRALAMLLCLIMALSLLPMVASAANTVGDVVFDPNQLGTLTIHKYKYNGTELKNGDGSVVNNLPNDAEPLPGVTFALYRVMSTATLEAYLNGLDGEADIKPETYIREDGSIIGTPVGEKKTGTDGTVVYEGLKVGLYLVIETDSPDIVTIQSKPFLVSIPLTSPDRGGWLFNVHVYPKNSTSEGNVILKKVDKGGNPLQGVTFDLKKENSAGDKEDYVIDGKTEFTTDTNGEIRFTGLPHGTYYLQEKNTLDGYILNPNFIGFVVNMDNTVTYNPSQPLIPDLITHALSEDSKTLTLTVRNEKPAIDKTVISNKTAAGVGTTVNYQVAIDVPRYIQDLSTFRLTDPMTNLKVDMDSIVITCEDTQLVKGTDYTLENSALGFTAAFVTRNLRPYQDKQLIVKYNARVIASAPDTGVIPNTAELLYSDVVDPFDPGSTSKISDSETVYNFWIDITKKAQTSNGEGLAGVEFKLYKDAAQTNAISFASRGDYYIVDNGENSSETVTTGANGKLILKGLPAGTYYLKETRAVEGYNLLTNLVVVNLGFTVDDSGETVVYKIDGIEQDSNGVAKTVINKKGFTLPQTGGIGALMFILIGGVLVGGGVALMNGTDKKRAR